MHSVPTPIVRILSIVLTIFLFFAVANLFGQGIFSAPVQIAYEAVENVAIEKGFQLVDNISFVKVYEESKAAEEQSEEAN